MPLGGRTCIGALIEWPEKGPYFKDLVLGAEIAAFELDMNLVVLSTRSAHSSTLPDEHPNILMISEKLLNSDAFDGLVVLTNQQEIAQAVQRCGKPVVSVGSIIPGIIPVLIESKPGFEALLSHLFEEHRYRDPVFMAGPAGDHDSEDRLGLFRSALKRYGIADGDERVFYGKYLIYDGEGAVEYFYDKARLKPDVIVCANDGMAIGVRQALAKRGLFVPRDVAVTGFDDIPMKPGYVGPLTTIRLPVSVASHVAVYVLRDLLSGNHPDPSPRTVPTELVVRRSCGCRPASRSQDPDELETELENEVISNIIDADRERFSLGSLEGFSREYIRDWRLNNHAERETKIIRDTEIAHFFVTTFEGGDPDPAGSSRLMIAWADGKRASLPESGVVFPTGRLLPEEYLPREKFCLVAEPLADGFDAFGLSFMQRGALGNNIHEVLGIHLSGAMRAVKIAAKLNTLNEELNIVRARLEELSLTDELTSLNNRRGFLTLAKQQAAYCHRRGEGFWILFIDLDGLKLINDRYGHNEGDVAIRTIGSVVQKAFRASDIVARLGGDEFVVFVANMTPGGLDVIKERFDRLLEEANQSLGKEWKLSMTMGECYSEPGSQRPIEELMNEADVRLYEEKKRKKVGR